MHRNAVFRGLSAKHALLACLLEEKGGRVSMGQTASSKPIPPCPLYVDLRGALVTVVGAGRVAERKIEMLLGYGARVRVIAPACTAAVEDAAAAGTVELVRRAYERGDLAGSFLVICATNDSSVNGAVYAEAIANSQFVNVVDVPDKCNVIVPSVLHRGSLQIAVSTGGAAPSVARDIRRCLEGQFDESWEAYVDVLGELRTLVKQRVPGPASARKPLYEALAAGGLRERIAAGERLDAEQVYAELVAPLVGEER